MKKGLFCKLLILLLFITFIISKDYYELLEITRDSSKKEMKKNYRRLSKKYHPDKNTGMFLFKIYQT